MYPCVLSIAMVRVVDRDIHFLCFKMSDSELARLSEDQTLKFGESKKINSILWCTVSKDSCSLNSGNTNGNVSSEPPLDFDVFKGLVLKALGN